MIDTYSFITGNSSNINDKAAFDDFYPKVLQSLKDVDISKAMEDMATLHPPADVKKILKSICVRAKCQVPANLALVSPFNG